MEVRSYRRVFDLERRIYSVDHLRLNPGGVPVRGIAYFLATLATVLLLSRLPLLGDLAALVPWYLRDLALPGAAAAVLAVIRVEGRPFHLAALALARHLASPRRLIGLDARAAASERWDRPELLALPDGADGMRPMRYTGPGAALVTVAYELEPRAAGRLRALLGRQSCPALAVRASPGNRRLARQEVIVLAPAATLLVCRERGAGHRL